MTIRASPLRAQLTAQFKRQGRPPTWEECKALAKKHDLHPSTVYKWGRRVYPKDGDKKVSDDITKGSGPSKKSPASDDVGRTVDPDPTSQGSSDIKVKSKKLDPSKLPKFTTKTKAESTSEGGGPGPRLPPVPDGASPQPPPLDIDISPIVDVFANVFNTRINQLAEHEKKGEGPPPAPQPISDEEKAQLVKAWGPFLLKYGAFLAKYSVEVNALFVTLAIVAPRLLAARRYYVYHEERAAPKYGTTGAAERSGKTIPRGETDGRGSTGPSEFEADALAGVGEGGEEEDNADTDISLRKVGDAFVSRAVGI